MSVEERLWFWFGLYFYWITTLRLNDMEWHSMAWHCSDFGMRWRRRENDELEKGRRIREEGYLVIWMMMTVYTWWITLFLLLLFMFGISRDSLNDFFLFVLNGSLFSETSHLLLKGAVNLFMTFGWLFVFIIWDLGVVGQGWHHDLWKSLDEMGPSANDGFWLIDDGFAYRMICRGVNVDEVMQTVIEVWTVTKHDVISDCLSISTVIHSSGWVFLKFSMFMLLIVFEILTVDNHGSNSSEVLSELEIIDVTSNNLW